MHAEMPKHYYKVAGKNLFANYEVILLYTK